MVESQTTRFKLPQWSAGTDAYPGRTGFNNFLKLLEDQAALVYPSGPISNRPSSGAFGRFYLATDQGGTGRLYYDGGSGWVELNTNGGGGPGQPLAIGGSGSEGVGNRSARADHTHPLPLATAANHGALASQHFDLLNKATPNVEPQTLAQRNYQSQLSVGNPTHADHAVNRRYIDNIGSHTIQPGQLVRRWDGSGSNGTIHVPTPTAPADAVNKGYADDLGAASIIPSAIVRRWSSADNGAISGPDPGKPEFYATKRYVDGRTSRPEWKENATEIPYGLDHVVELSRLLLAFDYKTTDDVPAHVRGETGVLGAYVTDVARIMPLLAIDSDDDGAPERIRETRMVWPAIRAIGQLHDQLEDRDEKIANLEDENDKLHDRIRAIENHLGL